METTADDKLNLFQRDNREHRAHHGDPDPGRDFLQARGQHDHSPVQRHGLVSPSGSRTGGAPDFQQVNTFDLTVAPVQGILKGGVSLYH